MPSTSPLAPLSLLTAATVWGLIWYPYRVLEVDGLSGSAASLLTYLLGIAPLMLLAGRGRWSAPPGQWSWLLAVALTAGWTNLSYVLAVINGEVMRVMLLFYLAPLWTVLFARLILKERPGTWGLVVIALAFGGAYVMLGWSIEKGGWQLPMPSSSAEWLGLSSGFGFALTNVLSRRARDIPMETRTLWSFLGVAFIAGIVALGEGFSIADVTTLSGPNWIIVAGITLALMLATLSVQYGLALTPANRAVVIMLFELVVAAISSQWLANETMGPREWLGGTMIIAATLFSIKLDHHHA